MGKIIVFIILPFLILVSCNQKSDAHQQIKPDTLKNKLKEVSATSIESRSKDDTEYLFKYIRKKALGLGLDFIENGFDSLQLRIWLGHSLARIKNVVILKNNNHVYSAYVISYYSHPKVKGEIRRVIPKSGWKILVDQINKLQIIALPSGPDIKGYKSCGGLDGIDYYFEIATKNKYRFYYYCNPSENINQYWQVKNMSEFTNLLEKEFDFSYTK